MTPPLTYVKGGKPGAAKASRALLDEVLRVLPPDGGLPPREVQARMGMWSVVTIRHALRELCREGSASFHGPDCNRRYFRTAVAGDGSDQ